MRNKVLSLLALLLIMAAAATAQVTTSGIAGKVKAENEAVIGATITAKHVPSGTVYRAVTNHDGRFTIQGMRVGGPYRVEITYIAYEPVQFEGIYLQLGETQDLSCNMQESAELLQEVVVTARSGLDATKTGAAQSINAQMIENMPTMTQSIADIARLNPQIVTNGQSGSMSFAGSNNRYNSFQIDGAMNNDVFGLTSNGSNGGQAGTQPVSMETIEQIQINVAPFDVRQGGFTGGAINAITKSGTNEFHGSVYGHGMTEQLIGRHYKNLDGSYAQPYDDEEEYRFGFTLGGPIVKDKLFFFANFEKSKKQYPSQYGMGTEGSLVNADVAYDILDKVKEMAAAQGFDYNGVYTAPDKFIKNEKYGLKLDWNINESNKFTVRWSYVDASQLLGIGGRLTANTNDHPYEFVSKTNTFVGELHSRLSQTLSNELRASYVRVRDQRTSGAPFPGVTVRNVPATDPKSSATVNIGNEYSSMANALDQDIFTLEDNLTLLAGNHTITLGTHNEFYKFRNLFIQNLYGCYYFNSPDDFNTYYDGFMAGSPDGTKIATYYFNQANVEVTGDPRWAAKFGAGQLGFYLQDKWDLANNFQLTYGARVEIPLFLDTPTANVAFNGYAAQHGWGVQTNHRLSSNPLVSPRLGFRWDALNNNNLIVRGGVGVFTGRIPFVWLSNSFSNTGIQLSKYQTSNSKQVELLLDPNRQAENGARLASSGSQEVNVFDKDFKFAQSLRANLGIDFKLLGINWTAEVIYSKTLNDVYYENLAYEQTGQTFGEKFGYAWDVRPMYQRSTSGTPFNAIYLIKNTSKGYTYNLSLKAEKRFDFGLDLMASYTFTRSRAMSSVTSSVASSNWNNTHTYQDSSRPEMGNSAFNIPHVVKASAFYNVDYGRGKRFRTTIGLLYEGRSGSPYSLIYYNDLNGDNGRGNDLMFIPTDAQADQMVFVANSQYSAEEQLANFKQWLGSTRYLRDHRGEYYKRYADNMPFESHFDVHVAEKFKFRVGQQMHALELSLDIMNVANLLNKDWGRTYSSSYSSDFYSPLTYSGEGKFQFLHAGDYSLKTPSDYYSRWRGQLSLKYTF